MLVKKWILFDPDSIENESLGNYKGHHSAEQDIEVTKDNGNRSTIRKHRVKLCYWDDLENNLQSIEEKGDQSTGASNDINTLTITLHRQMHHVGNAL